MIETKVIVKCDECGKEIIDYYEIRMTKNTACSECLLMPENIGCEQLCLECFKKNIEVKNEKA